MLFCFNKYLRRAARQLGGGEDHQQPKEKAMVDVISPCAKEAGEACAIACFAAPLVGSNEPASHKHHPRTATTTAGVTRSNFSRATTASLFPNTHFTNHESLPRLPDAFSSFTAAYPKYGETQLADRIRDREYRHLSDHICLDYAGLSLFSYEQMQSAASSSSHQPPFFDISYKSASLNSQVRRHGIRDTGIESAIRKRIMGFLNISDDEYTMVCTANRTCAFKLLAETYPFHSNKRLLTVYDYDSEAVGAMAETAAKRGAKVVPASFSWPSLRIHAARLRKVVIKRRKKKRGLFVFPLQSRMTGARYPYRWMSLAQENGWHVLLDACGLGPKDMDTLGLSLIHPDFIIFSFFKVFGGNPSGFVGLFIKKNGGGAALESSAVARSIGVVSIVPARPTHLLPDDFSGSNLDQTQPPMSPLEEEDDAEITSSFSGPINCNGSDDRSENPSCSEQNQRGFGEDGSCELHEILHAKEKGKGLVSSEIEELESGDSTLIVDQNNGGGGGEEIECRALDHADSMGLQLISSRLRYITNWLVIALMKLRHPHSENGHPLVRIYGPRVKFDRAPALAFNLFDWKGEKVDPALVQKLADRSSISLSCGFLHNIWFSAKYEERRDAVLERRVCEAAVGNRRKEHVDLGIDVVNVSLGFLTNFEDAYKLWAFVAKFLDADFVEKERWRYMALNQKMVEV